MRGLGLAMLLAVGTVWGADPFAAGVRATDPLTPAAAAKTFTLPTGFRIQLFAAEPEINKPMNLAFDARGRLWVTSTLEYPYPAKPGTKGRDSVKVLEDTDGDGRADKITTFADGLNIPTGVYPYRDGAIVWSIPNIWFLRDTDGDGRADRREKLYGPLGFERDTHGMHSSFTRGFDGWLHVTHGFNNNTTVRGRDGSRIDLQSGNTYRIRPDGARVEQFTWGQVNPFGMHLDARGYFYTADCHSSPIYQLIRGGYYPSFGKPHDGLGFAPTTITHTHGSTAICGITRIDDPLWPAAFQGNILVGNVMTSRINRDTIDEHGSSPKGSEAADFLKTTDPWFRPVDLQLGPDGALYVADFYNRIIGHYEVDLDHPGRDRTRGRIWRITYGDKTHPPLDLSAPAKTAAALGQGNLSRRLLAMHHLADTVGKPAVPALQQQLTQPAAAPYAAWALQRLGALPDAAWTRLAEGKTELEQLHALRLLAVRPEWIPVQRKQLLAALKAPNPHHRRVAAEVLGDRPAIENLMPLVDALQQTVVMDALQVKGSRGPDDHLVHTMRIAVRNHLRLEPSFATLRAARLKPMQVELLLGIAPAVPTVSAAEFLLRHWVRLPGDRSAAVKHVATHASATGLGELATRIEQGWAEDLDAQIAFYQSVQNGLRERGAPLEGQVAAWGERLAKRLLAASGQQAHWINIPLPKPTADPWALQTRQCADGVSARLMSSHPRGEKLTGRLRSRPFKLPARLSFFLCGHHGYPDQPANQLNRVRLVDARTGRALRTVYPPRHDTARQITWEFAAGERGREVLLEVVDADTAGAYAWLAVGRFAPALPELELKTDTDISHRLATGAELARDLKLDSLSQLLRTVLLNRQVGAQARAKAAQAYLELTDAKQTVPVATVILKNIREPLAVREAIVTASAARTALHAAAVEALVAAPAAEQVRFARALAGREPGGRALFEAVQAGRVPAQVLLDSEVRLRVPESMQPRLALLTRGVSSVKPDTAKLLEARLKQYQAAGGNAVRGAEVFRTACAACHARGGQGGNIGPQLDGLGSRGAARVVEDILDPNRNVDPSFRYATVKLKNGQTLLGLKRREVGQSVVFADLAGKEFTVAKSEIVSQTQTALSLMPAALGAALPEKDFAALLAYLLRK